MQYVYVLSPDKVHGTRSSRAVHSYGAAQEVLGLIGLVDSLSPAQKLGNRPHPETLQSSLHCHNQLPKISFNTVLLSAFKFSN
jgi:hypothetical protein